MGGVSIPDVYMMDGSANQPPQWTVQADVSICVGTPKCDVTKGDDFETACNG